MKHIANKYKTFWTEKNFLWDLIIAIVLFFIGLLTTYYANSYTLIHASNSVTDIFLDNLPIINVDFIYSTGAAIFIGIVIVIALYAPKRISFILKSSALFLIIRSLFMVLTHLAPPVGALYLDGTDFLHKLSSGDDLFFSAHTGFPFLMSLIFWHDKKFKYLFLACTFAGATAVLLGHLHYSIDVFSAFFITFGIFEISKKVFHKEYHHLVSTTT